MRFITISLTLLAALSMEWVGGARFSFFGVAPPIFSAVLFFWFSRIALVPRLALSASSGLILDSVSLFPFGTHIALYFVFAILAELFLALFSSRESASSIGLGIGISLFLFFLLAAPLGFAIGYFRGGAFPLAGFMQPRTLAAGFIWSLILPLLLIGIRQGFVAFRRRFPRHGGEGRMTPMRLPT